MRCSETYCQDCAKLIPSSPNRRLAKIQGIAARDNNQQRWVFNLGADDVVPMEVKMRHNSRHSNVTFDMAFRNGCEYEAYPYETLIYSSRLDENYPK